MFVRLIIYSLNTIELLRYYFLLTHKLYVIFKLISARDIFFGLCFGFFIVSADAEDQGSKEIFKQVIVDKKRLIRDELEQILKENNININNETKELIISKCLPKTSNFKFNECRLNLSLNYYYFNLDKAACTIIYKNLSADSKDNYLISKNDALNSKAPITEENQLVSYEPKNLLSKIIDADYYRCMTEKDWLNPNNPWLGKTKPLYLIKNQNYLKIN